MTILSVNVNKIAVLRNSRGGDAPSVTAAAVAAIEAGCGGITVHPRPDQRHIRPQDVYDLATVVRGRVEYNLEGNPFAPARDGYPGFLALVGAVKPTQATLVPDSDGQITSDHGFDLPRDAARLETMIAALHEHGCRVSLFVDAGCDGLERAAEIGADRVEIFIGPYAEAAARGDDTAALARCRSTALQAQALGLGINAGHDLSQTNLLRFLREVPRVQEVSIGHALVADALYVGLESTVQRYLALIRAATSN
jgi:pyridoxine 5-phosphate synthase